MKNSVLDFWRKIQNKFKFQHKTLIHIEGGLGSQILGAIAFFNAQDSFGFKVAKCDLSYFNHYNRTDLWEWNLHNYGIGIEDLRKFESHRKSDLLKAKKDFLTDLEISQEYWKNSRSKYLDRFPINEEQLQDFLNNASEKSNLTGYGAVHIRRGDYLQVASKVIGLDEYIRFLEKIKTVLPKPCFIITDSPLRYEEKRHLERAMGAEGKAIFLDGPGHDPFVLHCLMRRADLLITSNSTFSFSAGLLGKNGQIVFSPLEFHAGKDSEKYNRTFRSVGSFTSWSLDNARGTI
jgi:hypothetical protein